MENKKEKTIEERIDECLDKIRPFLQREGGNVELDVFDEDTGICYVRMTGACAGCIMAASDVSDSIEVMLMDEIPEIKKVNLVEEEIDVNQAFDDLLRRLAQESGNVDWVDDKDSIPGAGNDESSGEGDER